MKSWAIYIAAALGFAMYGAMSTADRDGSGAIVGEGTLDAFNVQVGDCYDDVSSYDEGIASVPGVPCSDPHDNETFAVFDLNIDSFLEEDAMYDLAYNSCMQHFEAFVGNDYDSSTLEITTMFPSAESWNQNDREVVCAIYDMDQNKLVGSAKDMGL